jgi:hypothetical protein
MTGAACEADLQRVYAEEIILLPDQDMVIVNQTCLPRSRWAEV